MKKYMPQNDTVPKYSGKNVKVTNYILKDVKSRVPGWLSR